MLSYDSFSDSDLESRMWSLTVMDLIFCTCRVLRYYTTSLLISY